MLLREVVTLLQGKVLTGEELLDKQVETCFGSDMMSQVLAHSKPNTLLCTGLTNMQVIRTADMTELCAIVFTGDKIPCEDIVEAGKEDSLPLLATAISLQEACEILLQAGLVDCK